MLKYANPSPILLFSKLFKATFRWFCHFKRVIKFSTSQQVNKSTSQQVYKSTSLQVYKQFSVCVARRALRLRLFQPTDDHPDGEPRANG